MLQAIVKKMMSSDVLSKNLAKTLIVTNNKATSESIFYNQKKRRISIDSSKNIWLLQQCLSNLKMKKFDL